MLLEAWRGCQSPRRYGRSFPVRDHEACVSIYEALMLCFMKKAVFSPHRSSWSSFHQEPDTSSPRRRARRLLSIPVHDSKSEGFSASLTHRRRIMEAQPSCSSSFSTAARSKRRRRTDISAAMHRPTFLKRGGFECFSRSNVKLDSLTEISILSRRHFCGFEDVLR